jgi:hypothetical protein
VIDGDFHPHRRNNALVAPVPQYQHVVVLLSHRREQSSVRRKSQRTYAKGVAADGFVTLFRYYRERKEAPEEL